jgi:hypothetical protein
MTRRDLAAAHYRIGSALELAGEPGASLQEADGALSSQGHFERSLELREELAQVDPTDTQSRIEWALALARCGHVAEADGLANELEKEAKGKVRADLRLLFQVACIYSVCSAGAGSAAADAYRDKALRAIEELIHSGWKDIVALRDDPDLSPLRDDPRLAGLLTAF